MNTKLQILSDLHNEFHAGNVPDIVDTEADVIILAGDIDKGVKGVAWAIEQSDKLDKPIIYVPGNHEYYGYDMSDTLAGMRWEALGTNVHVLDNDSIIIKGVRILGSTFWTDYSVDPGTSQVKAMDIVGQALNDHRYIKYGDGLFTTEDALNIHTASAAWLEAELAIKVKVPTVVVTHHGPSHLCQHTHFPLSAISSGFYSSRDDLVSKADLWIYGHTHCNLDTHVKGTRLVANQFGYAGREEAEGFNPKFVVQV